MRNSCDSFQQMSQNNPCRSFGAIPETNCGRIHKGPVLKKSSNELFQKIFEELILESLQEMEELMKKSLAKIWDNYQSNSYVEAVTYDVLKQVVKTPLEKSRGFAGQIFAAKVVRKEFSEDLLWWRISRGITEKIAQQKGFWQKTLRISLKPLE